MTDAPAPHLPPVRIWPPVATALVTLAAGVLIAALVASSAVERRITAREAAAVRRGVEAQRGLVQRLTPGQLVTGDPALRPIAEATRQRTGGTARLVGASGELLLQSDGTTRTDTAAIAAAALVDGHAHEQVIGPPGSRQRITVVPFQSPAGSFALIALTPAREAQSVDAARGAIRRGAVAGLLAGALLALAAGGYFRRKALIRSPKRS